VESGGNGIRGRVMSANTWHSQGTMSGFNAVNGLLMDIRWMTAPILLGGTGVLFMVIMLGSLLMVHLRALYARGLPYRGPGPLRRLKRQTVTVDGRITPSTSASKPCLLLLRHTAPQ
jgi:hypothetical protein